MAVERRVDERATGSEVTVVAPLDEPEIATNRGATGRVIPFSVSLVILALTYWTIDILSPALPAIKDDLGLSAAGAGAVFSLLFFGRLLANLPAAFLVDRIGSAITAASGGVLLTAGSLLAALASSELLLFPARVVQGAGISLLVTAALRSVLRVKPGQGAAMTYFGFAATLGGIFGLQSGGFLTESISWRAVFVLCIALGGVVSAASLVARGVAPSAGAEAAARPATGLSFVALAPALLFNFLVFFNYSIWVALPLYTERRFDASAEDNANLLLVITLMHLFAAFPAGRAIRKWGGRAVLIAGLVVATLGTLLVLPAPSLVWLIGPLALYGVGMVAAANAGGDVVLQRGGLSGRAVGFVRLSSDLGLVVGPYVTGTLTDSFGYRAPFVALPVVCAVAAVLAFREQRTDRSNQPLAAA